MTRKAAPRPGVREALQCAHDESVPVHILLASSASVLMGYLVRRVCDDDGRVELSRAATGERCCPKLTEITLVATIDGVVASGPGGRQTYRHFAVGNALSGLGALLKSDLSPTERDHLEGLVSQVARLSL